MTCPGVVRQFAGSDSESCWRCKAREASGEETPVKIDSISKHLHNSLATTNSLLSAGAVVDLKSRVLQMSSDLMTDLWRPQHVWSQVRPHLTARNVAQLGRLVMVLLLATFTGIVAGVKQLSNFSLKLLHELANLVDRSTPFALGALDMVSKMVGMFGLLLAMIWRDAVKKPSASASPSPVTGPVQSRAQLTMAGQPAASDVTRRNVVRQDPRGAMDNMYSQHRNW